jgi:hypothetical protein
MRKALKRPFSCDTCGKRFVQSQGVTRHCREKHNRSPCTCMYCNVEWSRPYQYRAHLKKHHPGVDPDDVLRKQADSRRRSTIIRRDPRQHSPPPPVIPNLPSQAEPRQRPMTPSLPTVAKVTRFPPPPMSPAAYYDPQPEHAVPEITMHIHEDARGLELTDIGATSTLLPTEEVAQSAKYSYLSSVSNYYDPYHVDIDPCKLWSAPSHMTALP